MLRLGTMVVRSGSIPSIKLIVEKRNGNTVATRVLGLLSYAIDLKAFCKLCQKKYAQY